MKDFRKLDVWKEAHELAIDIYKTTRTFPKEELFRLTSQLIRAAFSIPTNIAEGCGRGSDVDFARFVQNAIGSACEVEYLLLLAKTFEMLSSDDYKALNTQVIKVRKMLINLLKTLRSQAQSPKPTAQS